MLDVDNDLLLAVKDGRGDNAGGCLILLMEGLSEMGGRSDTEGLLSRYDDLSEMGGL